MTNVITLTTTPGTGLATLRVSYPFSSTISSFDHHLEYE